MSAKERRPVLVVLGMHRSGTSAVAGALVRRGANGGSALLPSTSDNANGYFEDARLVAASDALLAAGGLTWDEPGPLERPLKPHAVDVATSALVEVFNALRDVDAPAMVKDPRSCRLVPEWADAMARAELQPAYLLVLRDPREVTASLAARDGITAYRSEQLWLEHLLEAERDTRGAPRAFVAFDALLSSPEAVIDEALAAVGLGDRLLRHPSGETGVEPGLRRQRAATSQGDGLADEVFAFAMRLAGTAGTGAETSEAFDGFRRRWLAVTDAARAALGDARVRAEREREDAARLVRQVRGGFAMADAWVPAPLREPLPRVYWRSTEFAHSEDRSRAASISLASNTRSATAGGSGTRVDRLRIDPDDRAGAFEIRGLRIDGVLVPDLARSIIASSGIVRHAGDAVLLLAADDDPWIEIAIDEERALRAADAPLAISFDLTRRGLPELLWSLVEQEAFGAASLRDVERRLDSVASGQAALNAGQAALDAAATAQRAEAASLHERLGLLARESAELLGWTRRRTFRYWWRRWRGASSESTP